MNKYIVKSNRESGKGRYDLILKPARFKMPVYIFEFKKASTADDMEKGAEAILVSVDFVY